MKKALCVCLGAILISFPGEAQTPYRPGQMLVQTQSEADLKTFLQKPISAAGAQVQFKLIRTVSSPLGIHLLRFEQNSGVNDETLVRTVRAHPNIALAQFNHLLSPRCTEIDDPLFPAQWHHRNDGQNGEVPDADIDTDLVWDVTVGGNTFHGDTIVVCVIEGGNLNHPDLQANAWVNHGEIPGNGLDDDGNGYVDDYLGWNVETQNDEGVLQGAHGTSVMGMIGAVGGNGIGIAGANHRVKIMSVAGQDMSDEAKVVEAYTYPLVMRKLYNESGGESGAFVVATNASWGLDFGNPADVPLWTAVYDSLGAHGILNCVATANLNVNVDEVGDIPSTVASPSVVAVTASNSADLRTFSAWGPSSIDLAAPGQSVITTAGTSAYSSSTGTSVASPLTAGVIALLYSAPCPDLSQMAGENPVAAAQYIKQVLLEGVDILPQLLSETVSGGRLNAFNSFLKILEDCGETVCIQPLAPNVLVESDTVHTLSWINPSNSPVDIRFKASGDPGWFELPEFVGNTLVLDTLRRCREYSLEIRNACQTETDTPACLTFTTRGCCIAPEHHTITQPNLDGFVLNWTPAFGMDAHQILYRPAAAETWLEWGTTSETHAWFAGLESCMEYDLMIRPTCADSGIGLITSAHTTGCGSCVDQPYCTSGGGASHFAYISEFSLGESTVASGSDGGYALFEETGIQLIPGETLTALLTPGTPLGDYDKSVGVWLDANQDGIFSEDEQLHGAQYTSGEPVEMEITVPASAISGSTRLRVSMAYTGDSPGGVPPQACWEFQYGETEDYCVEMLEDVGVEGLGVLWAWQLHPNPGTGRYFVASKNRGVPERSLEIEIYDLSGRLLRTFRDVGASIDISDMSPGVYLYRIGGYNALLGAGKIILMEGGDR